MNKLLGKARGFLNDTMAELRKCSWPQREELYESTILVIVAVIVLAVYVALVDSAAKFIIELLTTL